MNFFYSAFLVFLSVCSGRMYTWWVGGRVVNQTIPGQTLWYWCGFHSTHKTAYKVISNHATNNLSGSWMIRKSVLLDCVLPNLATVENCPTVPETSCTSKKSCAVRTFGLVFADETCLMVINNKASAIVATIKVNNWYSSSRYYGTVFTVVLAVAGLTGVLSNVAFQLTSAGRSLLIQPAYMYTRCKSPVGKPRPHVKREDELTQVVSLVDDDPKSAAAAVPVHRSSWYKKLLFSFRSKQSTSDKDEA
ncbi:hypothetical protein VOLCADRAFT_91919 [Volvox carteri f. nagariensis]|uniref:Uncharacterized protein n=1 Tax=Volvox carteri f. nagariensis TaxID=3068 RepID=D8TYA8_VOLCA|nr:uncharacterized protein VOLCADRAFT_91919 [Volvox carteri f. nagariensis]EFJ47519.1 hypothetical protein VOLCADRAFT_91919 [Volvox carteri f. nagariensis]|eukprot:XP_002951343.1 hypothetical protein VOLCADRAFT_91919 [Volvox carteri f. nagariensis]